MVFYYTMNAISSSPNNLSARCFDISRTKKIDLWKPRPSCPPKIIKTQINPKIIYIELSKTMNARTFLEQVGATRLDVKVTYKDGKKRCSNPKNNYTREQIEALLGTCQDANAYSVFLRYTDLFVLDVDQETKEVEWFPITEKAVFIKSKSNKKLGHFYFRSDIPRYTQSVRVALKGDADLLHYQQGVWELWDCPVENFHDEVPFLPWKDIRHIFNERIMKFENGAPTEDDRSSEDDVEALNEVELKVPLRYTFEDVKKCVEMLSDQRAEDFTSWSKVVWAIYNCGHELKQPLEAIKLIHSFSKRSEKYNETRVQDFVQRNCVFRPGGLSFGTLKMYSKEDQSNNAYTEMKKAFEQYHFICRKPNLIAWISENPEEEERLHIHKRKDCLEIFQYMKFDRTVERRGSRSVETVQFIPQWFQDPTARTYDRIVFLPPPHKAPANTYNLWQGFAAASLPSVNDDDESLVEPVKDLMFILSGKDDKCYKYMTNWFAHIIQKPGVKTGTVITLYSKLQGVGKSTLIDFIGYKVIGNDHYYSTQLASDLTGTHANGQRNRVLINLDELKFSDTKEYHQFFKNFATAPKVTLNRKNIDIIQLDNFSNLITSTNVHMMWLLEAQERRNVLIECSDDLKGQYDYFTELQSHLSRPEVARAMYDYLMKVDIENFHPERDRPKTELYNEIQSVSIPVMERFLYSICAPPEDAAQLLPQELKYSATNMFVLFKEYIDEYQYQYKVNPTSFGLALKKFPGVRADREKSGRVWYVNHSEVVKYMHSTYGKDNLW